MKTNFSPLEINMLLHIYAIAEPIPNQEFSAQQKALSRFVDKKLIESTNSPGSATGFNLTAKGYALVKLICNTPIPLALCSYVDPRTNEVI